MSAPTDNPKRNKFPLWRLADVAIRPPQSAVERRVSLGKLLLLLLIGGICYGAVMGSFAWVGGYRSFAEQFPQMICSGLKVPCLLLLTMTLALPSFFVFNSLAGLRDDFRYVCWALLRAQTAVALILISFSPITMFLYVSLPNSGEEYPAAIMFNALIFGVASVAAQINLSKSFQPLIEKPRPSVVKTRLDSDLRVRWNSAWLELASLYRLAQFALCDFSRDRF